jgi:hypothetical protein
MLIRREITGKYAIKIVIKHAIRGIRIEREVEIYTINVANQTNA